MTYKARLESVQSSNSSMARSYGDEASHHFKIGDTESALEFLEEAEEILGIECETFDQERYYDA